MDNSIDSDIDPHNDLIYSDKNSMPSISTSKYSGKSDHSLRAKALALLEQPPQKQDAMDGDNFQKLLEELRLHQIELEIQNEELIRSRMELEASRSRYVSLFNNAPVGYVILDAFGMVKQFNNTFAEMIPHSRREKISGHAFAELLMEEDAGVFRSRFKAFYKYPAGKKMEVRLAMPQGRPCHVLLEATHHNESSVIEDEALNELLLTIADITDIKNAKTDTNDALELSRQRESEISALLQGAKAVLEQGDFNTIARRVFDICSELIGSTSGYVALLADDGEENEVLFLESGGLPCDVDPSLPMPIRGLREVAYRENRSVYENRFMQSSWVNYMPWGHVRMDNVMFAPLVLQGKTVGIIGMANKPSDFTDNDAKIAEGFGELAAIALQNSRNLDKRDRAERDNKRLIGELKGALASVKRLSGLLPICSYCKKIRDDKGYWNQIESYIHDHSDAEFSHSICRECADKNFPDLKIYED
ncbi:MAG: GAF domain-containing protein [Desulfamplus sp.]|nr:GAF domain-containing protein [Desulfamplus sp.]